MQGVDREDGDEAGAAITARTQKMRACANMLCVTLVLTTVKTVCAGLIVVRSLLTNPTHLDGIYKSSELGHRFLVMRKVERAAKRVGIGRIVSHVLLSLGPIEVETVVEEVSSIVRVTCAGLVAHEEPHACSLSGAEQGSDEEEGTDWLHGDLRDN